MKNIFLLTAALLLGTIVPAKAQNVPSSFADLTEKLLPSVVNISTTHIPDANENEEDFLGIDSSNPKIREYFSPRNPQQVSLGSGFIVDESGLILTNNHVIDQAKEITVTLADDSSFSAEIIGTDEKTDLALIKINAPKKLPAVVLGDSDKIRAGDWILAIGNPFGLGGSVTAGIVSAKSRDIEAGAYDNFIQTDASINQGSSGGPMFNMDGEVIGINSAIFSTSGGSMGIGFAVPVNLSKFVITQLKEKGKVERSWLGIKIQPNNEDISSSLNHRGASGIVVTSVEEKSPAKLAGIEAGDILLSLNGQSIENTKEFSRKIAEMPVGSKATIEFWRNKKMQTLELITQIMPETPQKPQPVTENTFSVKDRQDGYIRELGLTMKELSPEIRNQYHLTDDNHGLIVSAVDSGSDAEEKGLKAGDLITAIDKKSVLDINDARTYVEDAKQENNRPVLLLINNGTPHYAAVKLKAHE